MSEKHPPVISQGVDRVNNHTEGVLVENKFRVCTFGEAKSLVYLLYSGYGSELPVQNTSKEPVSDCF